MQSQFLEVSMKIANVLKDSCTTQHSFTTVFSQERHSLQMLKYYLDASHSKILIPHQGYAPLGGSYFRV